MKILIGASDICGMIHDLGEEYKKQGHKVITVASNQNKFYTYNYDIDPENLLHSFIKFKTNSPRTAKILSSCILFFGNKIRDVANSIIIRYLLSQTECYIQVYHSSLWEEERQLNYLHKKGKKIISLFVGSDIRDYYLFKEKFNIRRWEFNDEVNRPGRIAKERKLRLHEKYSDSIFSVPDQSMLSKRPYFHLQLALKTEKFNFNIPARDIPIVLHAPSNPLVKGTDLILETLEKLKLEGICFEFRLLQNLNHEELLKELTNADVLVDEIILHGPGFLSFEAMLSGCAVATKYLEKSPVCFRPPVININEDNITDQLRSLLTQKNLRIKLASEGREYALTNNNITKVSKDIVLSLDSKDFNYFP